MSVLIWGAGAIGGTVGAYLARAGVEVVFVDANRAHVEALRERGLELQGPIEAFTLPVTALHTSEVAGEWDTIFLCVKALHTGAAVEELRPHLSANGYVVSLQNGLNEHAIARALGQKRTVGAFVNFGADVLSPGVVHYGGRGAVVVGELDGAQSERLEELHKLLQTFEPDALMTDNIWGYLWGKMGYGATLFASALTDESIADVLASPEVQPGLTRLAREVLNVAVAEGVTPLGFNGFHPEAFLGSNDDDGDEESADDSTNATAIQASFDDMVAFNRRSAKTHSGVWRDLAVHGRKTEFEAQYGPILDLAEKHSLGVPTLKTLARLMSEVEQGERPRAWANLLELQTDLPVREHHATPL